MRHRHYHGPDALPHTVVQFHARGPHGTQTQRCKKTNRTGFGFKQRHPHRHVTGRDRMGLPTLQPLQDPIVLLPWVCFRGAAFLTLPVCRGHTAVELKGWTGSVRVQGGFYVTAPSAEAVEVE